MVQRNLDKTMTQNDNLTVQVEHLKARYGIHGWVSLIECREGGRDKMVQRNLDETMTQNDNLTV